MRRELGRFYMKGQNIGLALSGGGIRAMIFHLGLFKWLARNGLLEQVKRVSTVSGASLCVGMIYAHNNHEWPTSEKFLADVLPSIKSALSIDLQLSALRKLFTSPIYWNKRVNIVAQVLESKWGVYGELPNLSRGVSWYINCTTFETGKRFRFSQERMGDYTIGYVENPNIRLSEVMAASAGFPALIGPFVLRAKDYEWVSSKFSDENRHLTNSRAIHLWDGGVYDNFGLESIFKPDNGGTLAGNLDFLIVSNASPSIGAQLRKREWSVRNLKRLLDISMDQVASLRSRSVMDFIKRTNQGMYFKIGNSAEKITEASGCSEELKSHLVDKCLTVEQVQRAMKYKTTLRRPRDEDLHLLLRHGYEVADCTYQCYQKHRWEEL